MRTFLSIMILSVFISVGIAAQNPTRKVLYTLDANERIVCDEYFVQCHADGYRFALVTEDMTTLRNTLVFNGKRIPYGRITDGGRSYVPAMPTNEYNWNCLGYIDVTEPDGYILHCVLKSKRNDGTDKYEYWVNRGGKMEGPYEYVWFDKDDYELKSKTYHYVLADRVYDNVDGKVIPSKGIFKMPYYYASVAHNENSEDRNTYISVNGVIERFSGGYGDLYIKGNNYIVMTKYGWYFNGKKVSPGAEVYRHDVLWNDKGDYAYVRRSGFEYYIVKNGVQLNEKGYEKVIGLYLTENGDMAYCYNKKIHLPGMIEDIELKCKYISSFTYCADGRYALYYVDDNYDRYVKTEKTEYGPYNDIYDLVYGGEYYAFWYRKGDNWYVKTDKTEYGPYNKPRGLNKYLDYDGKHCAFTYEKDNNWYVKTDKTEFGPYYKHIANIKIAENGDCYYDVDSQQYCNGKKIERRKCNMDVNGHSFYFNYDYDYVVIDGQRFGKSFPFEYRYDKDKNAFVWYCIEGRDLTIYEYALD